MPHHFRPWTCSFLPGQPKPSLLVDLAFYPVGGPKKQLEVNKSWLLNKTNNPQPNQQPNSNKSPAKTIPLSSRSIFFPVLVGAIWSDSLGSSRMASSDSLVERATSVSSSHSSDGFAVELLLGKYSSSSGGLGSLVSSPMSPRPWTTVLTESAAPPLHEGPSHLLVTWQKAS